MTNRKNHNSIIFLTTLSLYLGLVMVSGATPVVFAQAATAQKFDVKSEIEVKDDLDNKPDDEKNFEKYFGFYQKLFESVSDIAKGNPTYLRNGKYEISCFNIFRADLSENLGCQGGGYVTGYITSPIQQIGKIFPYTKNDKTEQSRISLSWSNTEFFVKSSFTQDFDWQAKQFSDFYNDSLTRIKIQHNNDPRIIFYQNTQITFENNQVFIVTRLPRAAIDELFADKTTR